MRDLTLNLLAVGCYKLVFENDLLTTVTHCSGHSVSVPKEAMLHRKFMLVDNMDDSSSSLLLAPLPPVKLATFFAGGKLGPLPAPTFSGKPKVLEDRFDEIFTVWESEVRQRSSKSDLTAAIVEGLANPEEGFPEGCDGQGPRDGAEGS